MSRSPAKLNPGLSGKIKFVKSPGWDWVVYYRSDEDPETLAMSVFGQMRPEDALSEARWGLETGESDCEIVGIVRFDAQIPTEG